MIVNALVHPSKLTLYGSVATGTFFEVEIPEENIPFFFVELDNVRIQGKRVFLKFEKTQKSRIVVSKDKTDTTAKKFYYTYLLTGLEVEDLAPPSPIFSMSGALSTFEEDCEKCRYRLRMENE